MTSTSMIKVLAVSAIAFGSQIAAAHGARAFDDKLLLSATCSCKNAGDCTCKKGECKCKSCGKSNSTRVIDSLRGQDRKLELPQNARYEATGGVFI